VIECGRPTAIPPSLTHNFCYRAHVIASSFCFMIIVVWFTGQGMLQGSLTAWHEERLSCPARKAERSRRKQAAVTLGGGRISARSGHAAPVWA